ncbi:glycosyltransferase family 4 protein [Actinomycetospora sp. NBRC 106378]|uniref:glycosyltransferase family 4 protein n=1 Tax=Actinomycetospora sp. NBRC 106378 TaxID=3032208 RepID=UPI0024A36449|nr:glycosyltransferase family 4 protein [Actinomycetospora sp. NBRC 106378]GLZ51698.1 hypothetical protein Acsp07_13150 [Actinomycetospora sp. NBRC 106378]
MIEIHPKRRTGYFVANNLSNLTARFNLKVNWEVERKYVANLTRTAVASAKSANCDVLVAMGWIPYCRLKEELPVLYWGDATIGQRLDKAPHWSNLSRRTRDRAESFERQAFGRLDAVVMASHWAVVDVQERYGISPEKVKRIPFGANITDPGLSSRRWNGATLRILTVGVKWHRKGIDTAVLAVDALKRSGLDVRLDVVGVRPPDSTWERPYVRYWGFLSKEDEDDAAVLSNLYATRDIFLLPTRNDPFCLVVAEAAAFGMPVISTDTGGVPERIDRGGILVPVESPPSVFAEAIRKVVTDEVEYERFSLGAVQDFHDRTSWPTSSEQLLELCRSMVDFSRGVNGDSMEGA